MCFNDLYESFVVVGAEVWIVNGPFGVPPDPSGGWCNNRGFGAVQHGRTTSLVVCLCPFFYNRVQCSETARFYTSTPELVVILTFALSSSGFAIHGGPSPERCTRKHVWELHHPKRSVVSVLTGWDPGSGCQSGVEKHKLWQRRERLAPAAGVCLQLRPIAQDGEVPAEVRSCFLWMWI